MVLDYSSKYNPDQGFDSIISDETEKLVSKFISKGETILDVGCGTGRISKKFQHNEIFLVDISKKYLNEAKKNIPKAKIYHDNFLNIEFENCFDNIFIFNNIQEQEDIKNFLSKAALLLNDNGMLFVSYPNADSLHRIVGLLNMNLKNNESISKKSKELGTLQMINADSLKNIAHQSNLDLIHEEGFCFKPYKNEIMEMLDPMLIHKLNNSKIMMKSYSAMKLNIFKKRL